MLQHHLYHVVTRETKYSHVMISLFLFLIEEVSRRSFIFKPSTKGSGIQNQVTNVTVISGFDMGLWHKAILLRI